MSAPVFTKHLKVSETAGLLQREKRGRAHICRFDPTPLAEVSGWMGRYRSVWSRHFDGLDAFLRTMQDKAGQ